MTWIMQNDPVLQALNISIYKLASLQVNNFQCVNWSQGFYKAILPYLQDFNAASNCTS